MYWNGKVLLLTNAVEQKILKCNEMGLIMKSIPFRLHADFPFKLNFLDVVYLFVYCAFIVYCHLLFLMIHSALFEYICSTAFINQ